MDDSCWVSEIIFISLHQLNSLVKNKNGLAIRTNEDGEDSLTAQGKKTPESRQTVTDTRHAQTMPAEGLVAGDHRLVQWQKRPLPAGRISCEARVRWSGRRAGR